MKAAMWTLMGDLPRWFLIATVVVGVVTILVLEAFVARLKRYDKMKTERDRAAAKLATAKACNCNQWIDKPDVGFKFLIPNSRCPDCHGTGVTFSARATEIEAGDKP